MNKKVILIVLAVVIGVVGFLLLTPPKDEESSTSTSSHVLGASTTGVTLQEYGDFQCPACGTYYTVLQQVKEKYGDQISFQFSHFPLEAIHVNARAAARAAEAASNQGKFWEMHDKLYESQNAWSETSDPLRVFENYAESIGVEDLAKFTEDYRSATVNDTINADLDAGKAIDVQSTPSFIVDGEKIESPSATLEAFSSIIDSAIAEKTDSDDSGPEASKPEESETESTESE